MKLRERDEPLDPAMKGDLEAVDRALAGREVEPDLARWEELAALLSDERPEPSSEWGDDLDRRAAAGFREGGRGGSPGNLFARLATLSPGRLLAPAGALATLAVVAVVALTTLSGGGGDSSEQAASGGPAMPPVVPAEDAGEARSAGTFEDGAEALEGGFRASRSADSNKKIAPGTDRRRVERDVRLALSTKPDGVREVSDQAISITRSLSGIVASSQVSVGDRRSSATLELTVPTRNLDTAIDELTDLANVQSLDESTLDITKPYVSAQDRLADARAERRGLIEALGNASTDAEAVALRLQIADARRQISRARSAFENIARRASLSSISLTVLGDPDARDDRSLGDWVGDAGDVLRTVGGVLLVSAAVLVPLGILMALVWLVVTRLRRSRRERALD